jgi:hypothetical protein
VNQLFSIPVRPELSVKCSAGPGQLNTSEGVTACIALASVGGVEGSFFTAQRVRRDCRDIRKVIQTLQAAKLPLPRCKETRQ